MRHLTENLVLRPTPEQARWLEAAPPLHVARRDWIGTLLIGLCAFMLLRFLHAGPITSVMAAIVALAASASVYAPRIRHALASHAASRLRKKMLAEPGWQANAIRPATWGFTMASIGLIAIVIGYNVLALSVVAVWSGSALEYFWPSWPAIVVWSIALGWPALIIGERWLLWSIER